MYATSKNSHCRRLARITFRICSLRLAGSDADDVDFRLLLVPVRVDVLEGQPKLAVGPRRERSGADRLGIHIRLVRADKAERRNFNLRRHRHVVLEDHMQRDAGDGQLAVVGDVPVDIRRFAARERGRLAHLDVRKRQVRRVIHALGFRTPMRHQHQERNQNHNRHARNRDRGGGETALHRLGKHAGGLRIGGGCAHRKNPELQAG